MTCLDELLIAIRKGFCNKIPSLINQIDINIRFSSFIDGVEHENLTPIIFAGYIGNKNVIKKLLDLNADLNCVSSLGWSSLHFAAKYGHCFCALILLNNGANINGLTKNGESPLMLSMVSCKKMTITSLLKHGADIQLVPMPIIVNSATYNYIPRKLCSEMAAKMNLEQNDNNKKHDSHELRMNKIEYRLFSELKRIPSIPAKRIQLLEIFCFKTTTKERLDAGRLLIQNCQSATISSSEALVYTEFIERILEEDYLSLAMRKCCIKFYISLNQTSNESQRTFSTASKMLKKSNPCNILTEANFLRLLHDVINNDAFFLQSVTTEEASSFLKAITDLLSSIYDYVSLKEAIRIIDLISEKYLARPECHKVFANYLEIIYTFLLKPTFSIRKTRFGLNSDILQRLLRGRLNDWFFKDQQSMNVFNSAISRGLNDLKVELKEKNVYTKFYKLLIVSRTLLSQFIGFQRSYIPGLETNLNDFILELHYIIKTVGSQKAKRLGLPIVMLKELMDNLVYSGIIILQKITSPSDEIRVVESFIHLILSFHQCTAFINPQILLKLVTLGLERKALHSLVFNANIYQNMQSMQEMAGTHMHRLLALTKIISLLPANLKNSLPISYEKTFPSLLCQRDLGHWPCYEERAFYVWNLKSSEKMIRRLADKQTSLRELIFIWKQAKDVPANLAISMLYTHLKSKLVFRQMEGKIISMIIDYLCLSERPDAELKLPINRLAFCCKYLANFPDDHLRREGVRLALYMDTCRPKAMSHSKQEEPNVLAYYYSMNEICHTTSLMTHVSNGMQGSRELLKHSSLPAIPATMFITLHLFTFSQKLDIFRVLDFINNPRDFIRRIFHLITPISSLPIDKFNQSVDYVTFWLIFTHMRLDNFTIPLGSLPKLFLRLETALRSVLFLQQQPGPNKSVHEVTIYKLMKNFQDNLFKQSRQYRIYHTNLLLMSFRLISSSLIRKNGSFTLDIHPGLPSEPLESFIDYVNRFRRIIILINSLLPSTSCQSSMLATIIWNAIYLIQSLGTNQDGTSVFQKLKNFIEVDDFILLVSKSFYKLGAKDDLLSFAKLAIDYDAKFSIIHIMVDLIDGRVDKGYAQLKELKADSTQQEEKMIKFINEFHSLVEFQFGQLPFKEEKVLSIKRDCVKRLTEWSQSQTPCDCTPEKTMPDGQLYDWRREMINEEIESNFHKGLVFSQHEHQACLVDNLKSIYTSKSFNITTTHLKAKHHFDVPLFGKTCIDFLERLQPVTKDSSLANCQIEKKLYALDSSSDEEREEIAFHTINKFSHSPSYASTFLSTMQLNPIFNDFCSDYIKVQARDKEAIERSFKFIDHNLRQHIPTSDTPKINKVIQKRLEQLIELYESNDPNVEAPPCSNSILKMAEMSWFDQRPIIITNDEEAQQQISPEDVYQGLLKLSIKFTDRKAYKHLFSYAEWLSVQSRKELKGIDFERIKRSSVLSSILSHYSIDDPDDKVQLILDSLSSVDSPLLLSNNGIVDAIYQSVKDHHSWDQVRAHLVKENDNFIGQVYGAFIEYSIKAFEMYELFLGSCSTLGKTLEMRTSCIRILDMLTSKKTKNLVNSHTIGALPKDALTAWVHSMSEVMARLNNSDHVGDMESNKVLQLILGIVERFSEEKKDTEIENKLFNHLFYPLNAMHQSKNLQDRLFYLSVTSRLFQYQSHFFDINLFLRELNNISMTNDQLISAFFDRFFRKLERHANQFLRSLTSVDFLSPEETRLVMRNYIDKHLKEAVVKTTDFIHSLITEGSNNCAYHIWFEEWVKENFTPKLSLEIKKAFESLDTLEEVNLMDIYNRLFGFINTFYSLSYGINDNEVGSDSIELSMHDYSHILCNYKFDNLWIPGNDNEKPLKFQRVDQRFFIMKSKTNPKVINFHCTDGHSYAYLLKTYDEPNIDISVMRSLNFSNLIYAQLDPLYTMNTYNIVKMGPRTSLIRMVKGSTTLLSIYKKSFPTFPNSKNLRHLSDKMVKVFFYFARKHLDQVNATINDYLKNRNILSHQAKLEIFKELLEVVDSRMLINELWGSSQSNSHFWSIYQRFSHTMASNTISGYVVNLGDRHLDNILVNLMTGDVIHVDFSVAYDVGINQAVPELVPFRLTNTLQKAVAPFGNLIGFKEKLVKCLTQNQTHADSLTFILERIYLCPYQIRSRNYDQIVLESYQSGHHLDRYKEFVEKVSKEDESIFSSAILNILSCQKTYLELAKLASINKSALQQKCDNVRVMLDYAKRYLSSSDYCEKSQSFKLYEIYSYFMENNAGQVIFINSLNEILSDNLVTNDDTPLKNRLLDQNQNYLTLLSYLKSAKDYLQVTDEELDKSVNQLAIPIDHHFVMDQIACLRESVNEQSHLYVIVTSIIANYYQLVTFGSVADPILYSRSTLTQIYYQSKFFAPKQNSKFHTHLPLMNFIEKLYLLREEFSTVYLKNLVNTLKPSRQDHALLKVVKEFIHLNRFNVLVMLLKRQLKVAFVNVPFIEALLEAIECLNSAANEMSGIRLARIENISHKMFFFQEVINPILASDLLLSDINNNGIRIDWRTQIYRNGLLVLVNYLLKQVESQMAVFRVTSDSELAPPNEWLEVNIFDEFDTFFGDLLSRLHIGNRFVLAVFLYWFDMGEKLNIVQPFHTLDCQMAVQIFSEIFLTTPFNYLNSYYVEQMLCNYQTVVDQANLISLTSEMVSKRIHLDYLYSIEENFEIAFNGASKNLLSEMSPNDFRVASFIEKLRFARTLKDVLPTDTTEVITMNTDSLKSDVYERLLKDKVLDLSPELPIHKLHYRISNSLESLSSLDGDYRGIIQELENIFKTAHGDIAHRIAALIKGPLFNKVLLPLLDGLHEVSQEDSIFPDSIRSQVKEFSNGLLSHFGKNYVYVKRKALETYDYSMDVQRKISEKLHSDQSVSDQIDLIISQATDPNNLSQMFEGWQSWV